MSISGNRTAFARTRRNPGKTPGSNDGNLPIKRTVINAAYIDAMKAFSLPSDVNTVMGIVDGECTMTFSGSANGSFSMFAPNEFGRKQMVADEADIKRIGAINASVNAEKKAALKDEAFKGYAAIIAAIVKSARLEGKPILKLPDNFVETVTATITVVKKVNSFTADLIKHVPRNDGAIAIKNVCLEQARLIRDACGKFLMARARHLSRSDPPKLMDSIRDNHVSSFVFKVINEVKITDDSNFDLCQVFFPNDPSKGVFVTWREYNSSKVRDALGPLWKGNGIIEALLDNKARLAKLCGFDNDEDEDLVDFVSEKKIGRRLAPVRIPLVPHHLFINEGRYFASLARDGIRGFGWSSGTITSSADLFGFLVTIPKRMMYCGIPRPAVNTSIIEKLFIGFKYKPDSDKHVFRQLDEWAKDNVTEPVHLWRIVTEVKPLLIKANVEQLVGMFAEIGGFMSSKPKVSSIRHLIEEVFITENIGEAGNYKILSQEDAYLQIVSASRSFSSEGDALREIGSTIPTSRLDSTRKGRTVTPGLTERSRLSSAATECVALIKSSGKKELSERMSTWFRGFLSVEVQSAVAGLVAARWDAFKAAPVEFDHSELRIFFGDGYDEKPLDWSDEMDRVDPDPGKSGGDTSSQQVQGEEESKIDEESFGLE